MLPFLVAVATAAPITVALDPPTLQTEHPTALVGMSWDKYHAFAANIGMASFVRIREPLAEDALYGMNVVLLLDGQLRNLGFSLAWAGDQPQLRIDADGDGRLTGDEQIPLVAENGIWRASTSWTLADGEVLPLAWAVDPGQRDRAQGFLHHRRQGRAAIGDATLLLVTEGGGGHFAGRTRLLGVDLDGDGQVTLERDDAEVFRHEEAAFSWRGTRYAFTVDVAGRSVYLDAVGAGEDRAPIEVGALAPDFPLGDGRTLHALRGQPVLLDFWTPHCGFCRALEPELVAAARPDVPFISITDAEPDQASRLRAEWGATWTALDGADGDAVRLAYRIYATPTLILVDAEGRIAAMGNGTDWPRIAAQLPVRAPSATQ